MQNGFGVCSHLTKKTFLWQLQRSVYPCLTVIRTNFCAISNHGRNTNSLKHTGDQVSVEIVSFSGQIGIEGGRGGSVSQQSLADSFLRRPATVNIISTHWKEPRYWRNVRSVRKLLLTQSDILHQHLNMKWLFGVISVHICQKIS